MPSYVTTVTLPAPPTGGVLIAAGATEVTSMLSVVDQAAADAAVTAHAVRFDAAQTLTSGQATQARANMGLGTIATADANSYVSWSGTPSSDLSAFGVYLPEAHGAVGDGVADDTTAVQAALTAVPNGSRVYLGRTYKTTAQLNLSGKTGVTVCGPGSINDNDTTVSTTGTVYALQLVNCTDCAVDGITVNVVTQTQNYNGIQITTSSRVTVRNCKVLNARWAGIAAYDSGAPASDTITIEDNYVYRCRFGISGNAKWLKIHHNTIATLYLSSDEGGSPWTNTSKYWDGIILTTSPAEFEVTDNLIIEAGQSAIYASDSSKGTITGNTILRPQNWGIDSGPTTETDYWTITGNTVIDAASGSINLFNTNYSTVSGNTVINTGALYFGAAINKAGIALNGSSSYNTVVGNTVVLPASATANGIFANAVAPKAVKNVFSSNNVQAPNPRSINTTDNTLLDLTTLLPTSAFGAHMVSGNYYATPGTNIGTGVPAEATVFATPLYIGTSGTINQLAASITGAGTTGAVLRMGIYADDGSGSYPGALLADGGTVAATATGVVTVPASVPVTSGTLVWLACAVQGGATTRPTVRQLVSSSSPFNLGDTSSTAMLNNTLNAAQINTTVAGALPSSATWFHTTSCPRVAAKAA